MGDNVYGAQRRDFNSPRGRGGFRGGRGGGGGGQFRGRGGGGFGGGGGFRRGGGGNFRGRGGGGDNFRGRGGGFRGSPGGFRGRGGGNFNKGGFGQNRTFNGNDSTPQNRKRKFNEDGDEDQPQFKKNNQETDFFQKSGRNFNSNKFTPPSKPQTPGILKKGGEQSAKKNVHLSVNKPSPAHKKTPATPHPAKQHQKQPFKQMESESDDEDEELSDEEVDVEEESDNEENVSKAGKLAVESDEDEEDEDEEEDDESSDVPVPENGKPAAQKKDKMTLDGLSAEQDRRLDLIKASLFAVPTKPGANAAALSKCHPFVIGVWSALNGHVVIFDSPAARDSAKQHVVSHFSQFKFTDAASNKDLLALHAQEVEPLIINVSHVPDGVKAADLKVLFPGAQNVNLTAGTAVVSFADHKDAVKCVSKYKFPKIYGKPVWIKFNRGKVDSKLAEQVQAVTEKGDARKVVKKVAESSDDEDEEAEDEEAEDEEIEVEDEDELEDGEDDTEGQPGLVDAEAEESEEVPSSEEGIEEVSDEDDEEE